MRAADAGEREWSFRGLTGPRMRARGAETIFDMTAQAAMLAGAAKLVRRAWQALGAAEKSWREQRPDVVVLLDSPELHLPMAKRAKRAGIPVVYYIAPQTWASRPGRNKRIARDVDRLACILPFEQDFFQSAGVRASFVGHPLFEALARENPDRGVVDRLRSGEGPLIALLPGSRKHVIRAMLPLQLRVLSRLKELGISHQAAVSAVDEDRAGAIRRLIREDTTHTGGSPEVVVDDNAGLLSAADLVLVASGTATLHVAHYRKPMVVMYDAGAALRLPHRLFGRYILKTPHLSLVNILARRRVVPEFMPFVDDTALVASVCSQLLRDEAWRRLMSRQIDEVVRPLAGACASENVCAMIEEMLSLHAPG